MIPPKRKLIQACAHLQSMAWTAPHTPITRHTQQWIDGEGPARDQAEHAQAEHANMHDCSLYAFV
jgi:hypothetical protein